jgi:hypothetical protein
MEVSGLHARAPAPAETETRFSSFKFIHLFLHTSDAFETQQHRYVFTYNPLDPIGASKSIND